MNTRMEDPRAVTRVRAWVLLTIGLLLAVVSSGLVAVPGGRGVGGDGGYECVVCADEP